jgi:integrating conjugative element relaxase (TIGR03760 family)
MLSLLLRKKAKTRAASPLIPGIGLTSSESAQRLLATPRRQKLLNHIWQRTALSRTQFASLYLAPLQRYADLVQHLPASESHHHAYPGGMLDHGLETVAYALKLRQSHLLPVGAPPERQAAEADAWTAATAYGALLHDIGKIVVDLHVETADGKRWHPWHGPLTQPYRFRYKQGRDYRLHNAAAGLLYTRILDTSILDWLSGYPDLFANLLYLLAGQYDRADRLGQLITQADQASVAQELGGDPTKALAAPKHALQRKLLDGLRYLLKEELKLNQPQASDGWLTQDALWLVSKTVCDKLRAHLLTHGFDGIPQNNSAVFNVLQDHGIAQAASDDKAIWRATVVSESGWTQTFTFLKVAPALIWDPAESPATFTGTVTPGLPSHLATIEPRVKPARPMPTSVNLSLPLPTPVPPTAAPIGSSPVPEDAGVQGPPDSPSRAEAEPTGLPALPTSPDDPIGQAFFAWLRAGISTHRVITNDAKALVHTVDGTAFLVSPGVFRRYAQEHPRLAAIAVEEKLADWEFVQKSFERLRMHRKQPSGLNIWTCEVTGPRKSRRLHGYLIDDPALLLPDVQFNNPYLKLSNS